MIAALVLATQIPAGFYPQDFAQPKGSDHTLLFASLNGGSNTFDELTSRAAERHGAHESGLWKIADTRLTVGIVLSTGVTVASRELEKHGKKGRCFAWGLTGAHVAIRLVAGIHNIHVARRPVPPPQAPSPTPSP